MTDFPRPSAAETGAFSADTIKIAQHFGIQPDVMSQSQDILKKIGNNMLRRFPYQSSGWNMGQNEPFKAAAKELTEAASLHTYRALEVQEVQTALAATFSTLHTSEASQANIQDQLARLIQKNENTMGKNALSALKAKDFIGWLNGLVTHYSKKIQEQTPTPEQATAQGYINIEENKNFLQKTIDETGYTVFIQSLPSQTPVTAPDARAALTTIHVGSSK